MVVNPGVRLGNCRGGIGLCRGHKPNLQAEVKDSATHTKDLGRDVAPGPSSLQVTPMSEMTRILSAIEQGDPHAAEELLPLVYDELRKLAAQKLAQEKPGQTLQATALVHEAYLRLLGNEAGAVRWTR